MEPLAETLIEDERWRDLDLAGHADSAVRAVLAELGLPEQGFVVSLLGCDDERIAALNADFRGRSRPTNVLSWPSEERGSHEAGAMPDLPRPGKDGEPMELGDIAIAYETCAREAAEHGKPLVAHVLHLLVHGTLHLFGFDHEEPDDADLMEAIEVRALARLGVDNPY